MKTNGINLHVIEDGPPDGPLVILLHGFPEFWYGWRQQIPALVEAGYHVLAPDQRGYNVSNKPKGIGAYNLDLLAQDVVGLIDAQGRDKAFVVGHDWGALVTWWLGMKHADRLQRMTILNVPHPLVGIQTVRRSPQQLLRSLYVAFFQIPRLPEALLRLNNGRGMVQAMQGSSRPDTFTNEDFQRYRSAWAQPGAITAMLNYYRAFVRRLPPIPNPRVTVPTRLIWGVHDMALSRQMAQPSIDLCDDGQLIFIEEATHWVQHDEPDRVNRLLLEFFGSSLH
ncbi:MAG: alpha/beta hydrolase [Anaerolineae bacterium]|nr:alpha/beta hydrolase [Anaerolineae bacterium]